jgi:hypothetical protein
MADVRGKRRADRVAAASGVTDDLTTVFPHKLQGLSALPTRHADANGAGDQEASAPFARQEGATMDRMPRRWHFKEGDEVRTGDDHKLGNVVAFWPDMAGPTHLVVECGLLFHHDYYVPVDAVTTHDGERIYVDATKAEAKARGWDAPPAGAPPADDLAAGP